VRRLCRCMDDEVRSQPIDELQHGCAVADVDVVVLEAAGRPTQAFEIPGRIAVLAEEVAAHVVVDAVDGPTTRVEERHGFGADQAA
jgi:hypothetical protein